MTNSQLNFELYKELFEKNIELIEGEIKKTDELYNELKKKFDKINNSTSPGSLNFIAKQTPNLVSLRNNRISLIKELNTVQKIIIDSTLKTKNVENDENSEDNIVLKKLHKILMNPNSFSSIEEIPTEEDTKFLVDQQDDNIEEYENAFEEAYNSLEDEENYNEIIKDSMSHIDEEENSEEYNSDIDNTLPDYNDEAYLETYGYRFVCDMDRNIYAIDENYDMLELEEDEYPDWIIDYYYEDEDDEDSIYAENQNETIIEIIDME